MNHEPPDQDETDPPLEDNISFVNESAKNARYDNRRVRTKIKSASRGLPGARLHDVMNALGRDAGGLIHTLNDGVKKAVLKIPNDLIGLDEDDLVAKLKRDFNYVPSPTIEALRTNFWMEFDRLQITKEKKMNEANIYMGACSHSFWKSMCTANDQWHMMSYIITKPIEYETNMRSLLNLSTRRLRDILMIPLIKADGEYRDPKTMDVILKAAAMVDMRAKGAYIQKIEQKNLSIISSHSTHDYSVTKDIRHKPIDQLDGKEIEKRLALLNAELEEYDLKQLSEKAIPVAYTPVQDAVIPEPMDTDPTQTQAVPRVEDKY